MNFEMPNQKNLKSESNAEDAEKKETKKLEHADKLEVGDDICLNAEINKLKKEDQKFVNKELLKVRESLKIDKIENEANFDKKIEGFNEAYRIVLSEIEKIIKEKGQCLLTISGKSGSGKSTFSEDLIKKVDELGIPAVGISTDNYYREHKGVEDKELDTEKLQTEIEKLSKKNKVVFVEGVQAIDNNILDKNPDFKVFIETDFGQRMARKLIRDEKNNFRTVKESLELLAKISVNNPDLIKKFEGDMDVSDVNLQVNNTYKNPDNPELYIKGEDLVYSVSDKQTIRNINDTERESLIILGVEQKNK